jgi:hypothetical protein
MNPRARPQVRQLAAAGGAARFTTDRHYRQDQQLPLPMGGLPAQRVGALPARLKDGTVARVLRVQLMPFEFLDLAGPRDVLLAARDYPQRNDLDGPLSGLPPMEAAGRSLDPGVLTAVVDEMVTGDDVHVMITRQGEDLHVRDGHHGQPAAGLESAVLSQVIQRVDQRVVRHQVKSSVPSVLPPPRLHDQLKPAPDRPPVSFRWQLSIPAHVRHIDNGVPPSHRRMVSPP